jgi:hypothetical protein
MEFVQKPEVIVAVQWKGTLTSADEVVALLKSAGHPGDVELILSSGKIVAMRIAATVNNSTLDAPVTDWVAKVGGKITVVSNEEMMNRYNPA